MNLKVRLPLMALAGAALLAALWAGLARLGWRLPSLQPAAHGPLMISGFLGTLISLERAVALQRRWPYLAPLLSGLGGLALLLSLPAEIALSLSVLGSLGLVVIFHAPIILPAVLNRAITYRSTFYVSLVLLHLSLIIRVASDLWFSQPGRLWGGLLNVIAVLMFLGNLAWAIGTSSEPSSVTVHG